MSPNLADVSLQTDLNLSGPKVDQKTPALKDSEILSAARDFEAAFITQMLKYSGLGEALTKSGGESVSAFTDFYLEEVAQSIADKGGFGLAKTFYAALNDRAEAAGKALKTEL